MSEPRVGHPSCSRSAYAQAHQCQLNFFGCKLRDGFVSWCNRARSSAELSSSNHNQGNHSAASDGNHDRLPYRYRCRRSMLMKESICTARTLCTSSRGSYSQMALVNANSHIFHRCHRPWYAVGIRPDLVSRDFRTFHHRLSKVSLTMAWLRGCST